jgi:hypothetical protein
MVVHRACPYTRLTNIARYLGLDTLTTVSNEFLAKGERLSCLPGAPRIITIAQHVLCRTNSPETGGAAASPELPRTPQRDLNVHSTAQGPENPTETAYATL